jgi:hypothetical protein
MHVCKTAYLCPKVGNNGIDEDAVVDLHAKPPLDPFQCAEGVEKEDHKDVWKEVGDNHSTPTRTGPIYALKEPRRDRDGQVGRG